MTFARRFAALAAWALVLLLPLPAAAAVSAADSLPVPPPAPLSYGYDAFDQSLIRPMTRLFDPALLGRKLSGSRREAADIDAQDRVELPSTWWQPRLGFKPVSVEEMLSGPGPGTGPAAGHWTITSAKSEGVSKGFTIKDSAGDRFAIKFDPPGCEELGTGADVVASKLYWAAGYNVPDNTIASVRREDLEIAADATRKVGGHKVPLTPAFLDELLRDVPRQADGSYRVVASRFLKGKPLGEWRYDGRRRGDREDQIPHELRREIRGLWAINAWINHTDCSARNTLDVYVTDGGRSFVRHHLLDFSGCLGSASIAPQPLRSGHEYWLDYRALASSLVTLGTVQATWEHSVDPQLTGVGFIDSETFDAGHWRPYLPNPAFDVRTDRDIRWGARIVAAFTDEHIRAAVEQGRFSDPAAAAYLVRILEERRDKLARRWLPANEAAEAAAATHSSAAVAAAVVAATDTLADTGASAPAPDSSSVGGEAPAPVATPEAKPHRLGMGGRVKRATGNFFSDGWIIVSAPARARGMQLVWTGAFLGAGAVIFNNDQAIMNASLRNAQDPVYHRVLDIGGRIEPVGFMGRTNPFYVAALGAGYAFNIRVLRTVPTEILESHLLAGGVRNVGKLLVGREHPYQNDGPYVFKLGHGTSFPSGHTSVAFELATIASMNAHFWPVTIVAYSAATALAAQRIQSGNHWPSDVFIAAGYGTFVSHTVVRLHREREAGRTPKVSLTPEFSRDGQPMGVRLTRRF